MRLLIVTQAVDLDDPVLGFFHDWIRELAKVCDSVIVICLRAGTYNLPENVTVFSLGKEQKATSSWVYSVRFLRLVWKVRSRYDSVLVHMNEEYVLLAGAFWRMFGKKVFLWRNHYSGSWKTTLAEALCTNLFCTSTFSYIAKNKKTILMPVGVDILKFTSPSTLASPNSILFLSRIAPSKRIELLLEALEIIKTQGVSFTATIVGSPSTSDKEYYKHIQQLVEEYALQQVVQFLPAVANNKTPELYAAHALFVNASPSGMFDKTLFEAAASGCIVLASSKDFHTLAGSDYYFDSADMLAKRISTMFSEQTSIRMQRVRHMYSLAQNHSLSALIQQLMPHLQKPANTL